MPLTEPLPHGWFFFLKSINSIWGANVFGLQELLTSPAQLLFGQSYTS